MVKSTGFYDRDGIQIYSDSLIADHSTSESGLAMPLVWSLVCQVNGEYGIYDMGGHFLPFKAIDIKYVTVEKPFANDKDLLKHRYIAKRSLRSYCDYCMGNAKVDYEGLKVRVEPKQLFIDKIVNDGFVTYDIPIKACPFCGRKFNNKE